MPRERMPLAWLLCCAFSFSSAAQAQTLSFSDAVAVAAADGPTIEAGASRVEAAQRSAHAAGRLPDPVLVLALDSFPVSGPNAGSFTRDDFTMERVGIMQAMPSGAERRARRNIAGADIARADAAFNVARLEARLGAADAWIKLYFAERRLAVLGRLAGEARSSAQAARARLGAGGANVDDALSAEIDAARTEDRRGEAEAALVAARAELRRWIDTAADAQLADGAPAFAIDPDLLRQHFQHHPALAAFAATREAAEADLRLARAETHPDWSWELSYQRRDPSFGDYASAEVRIGLPLFQGNRQRPLIDARRLDVNRVGAERAAAVREHLATLEARLAEHRALSANLVRARETRLPLAQRRVAAAAGAFAAAIASSDQLIAARRDALEAELDVLDLQERLAALGAALTLQYSETLP